MPTGRFGHLYAASRRTTQWRPFIRTWEHFSTLWPTRDDPFSRAMNAASKAVVTHREIDPDVWAGSVSVDGPLVTWVRDTVPTTDVVVIGSGSVDEYRLLVFPTPAGSGRRLFPAMQRLELASAEQVGPAALGILTPVRAWHRRTGSGRPWQGASATLADMNDVARSLALFVLAALTEIGGAWLVWQGVREHRGWVFVGAGVVVLGVYGFVATLQPDAHFGRILAAYGGVFVAGSLAWGMVMDGFRPDRYDITGAVVCLAGVAVIMYAPRSA